MAVRRPRVAAVHRQRRANECKRHGHLLRPRWGALARRHRGVPLRRISFRTRALNNNHIGIVNDVDRGQLLSTCGPGRRVSSSSPPGRPHTPAGRPDGPKVSQQLQTLGLSAGGCRVKSGSGPLERSLPPGLGALERGRTDANGDPPVMPPLTRRGTVRAN